MDNSWIDFSLNKIASTQCVDNDTPHVYIEMSKKNSEKFLTYSHIIIL